MDLTEMTEDEFLCTKNIVRKPDAFTISAKEMETTILEEMKIQSLSELPVVLTCGDYRIVRLGETDTGLIDRNCNLVGYYMVKDSK
jgi:hypothetical protein